MTFLLGDKKMQIFQDDCVTKSQYAKMIGRSRRTVQRYIKMGMPELTGTHKSIHIPSVNAWWKEQVRSLGGNDE